MKILIAEDEQRARHGLRELIGCLSGEYEVVAEAANGQRALELIKLLTPDVVFTDIRMPFMDGLELIRAVRANRISVDFVVISAYTEFEFARQCISLGVTDYLLKPLALEDVQKTLFHIAEKHSCLKQYTWEKSRQLRAQYPAAHPLVQRLLDLIENNYADKLNQRELAQQLEVSPEYLSFLFSRDVGTSFSKFLKEYRIQQAKQLYRDNSCPTSEVPYQVGFSDEKYFKKVFREVSGVSVSEFLRSF